MLAVAKWEREGLWPLYERVRFPSVTSLTKNKKYIFTQGVIMSTNTKPKGLADKAMLVSLTISQWVINVADRAATLQFSNDHSVNQNCRLQLVLSENTTAI